MPGYTPRYSAIWDAWLRDTFVETDKSLLKLSWLYPDGLPRSGHVTALNLRKRLGYTQSPAVVGWSEDMEEAILNAMTGGGECAGAQMLATGYFLPDDDPDPSEGYICLTGTRYMASTVHPCCPTYDERP